MTNPETITLTVENMKYALGFCVAGYLPLVLAIKVLYTELIKSKEAESETLREVLPLVAKLVELNKGITSVFESKR